MNRKHVFILNPAAGQGKAKNLIEEILTAGDELGQEVELYETKEVMDGEVVARRVASAATEEHPVRIYACGGDGTVNEVLNGIVGYENVELAVIPLGTGNDFIRNFGTKEQFLNIKNQILGKSQKVDILKYKYCKDDYSYEKFCINMFNIGFDCKVAHSMSKYKKMPLISGSMAYIMGIIDRLYEYKGENLCIQFDDGEVYSGELLLVAIANGCFCGGGVKGVPLAEVDDGLIDVSLVEKCTRKQLVRIFSKYAKGTHLDTKLGQKIVTYKKCRSLNIRGNNGDFLLCIDGETCYVDEISIENVPQAVNVSIPVMD